MAKYITYVCVKTFLFNAKMHITLRNSFSAVGGGDNGLGIGSQTNNCGFEYINFEQGGLPFKIPITLLHI